MVRLVFFSKQETEKSNQPTSDRLQNGLYVPRTCQVDCTYDVLVKSIARTFRFLTDVALQGRIVHQKPRLEASLNCAIYRQAGIVSDTNQQ